MKKSIIKLYIKCLKEDYELTDKQAIDALSRHKSDLLTEIYAAIDQAISNYIYDYGH